MIRKISLLLLLSVIAAQFCIAQDSTDNNLLNMLNDSIAPQQAADDKVSAIFKATQVIDLPTVEQPGKNNLQFIIMHRFGQLNGGAYQLFGLDNATIRFGLDYGLTDRLAIGLGRSSLDKTFDGSFKYKLFYQRKKKMPVAISWYEMVTTQTLRYTDKPYMNLKYRTAYTSQLLIARKFTEGFSFEIVPSWVHYNLVPTPQDKNNIFLTSIAGRLKITKRMSVDAEYNYLPNNSIPSAGVHSSLGLGLDIETGGHVFQFVFSNSQGMVGPYYLTGTNGTWGKGDIYFGFNISRSFGWNKHDKKKNKQTDNS
ncbi:MAG TPA: DUF5777 family beta-barrel protein [Arachidicoccus sp.]